MGKVTVAEALPVRLQKFLEAQGCRIEVQVTPPRMAPHLPESELAEGFHLSLPHHVTKGVWWWKHTVEEFFYTSTLWIRNAKVGTKKNNWVVEVHGRQYMDESTQLARKVSTAFDVRIHVRLVTEEAWPLASRTTSMEV